MKINRKKGILFWIEGFSGSGKTEISKKIKNEISNKYGPTLLIQGDNLRRIFKLFDYTKKGRYQNYLKFSRFAKFITDQNINLIFTVVGMQKVQRNWLKKNINNYIEIYIQTKIQKIKKNKNRIYDRAKTDIVGVHIKPEIPKNPNIRLINNMDKNLDHLSNKLLKKIFNTIK
jgi:adenylylsulfate kinase-like enzyme